MRTSLLAAGSSGRLRHGCLSMLCPCSSSLRPPAVGSPRKASVIAGRSGTRAKRETALSSCARITSSARGRSPHWCGVMRPVCGRSSAPASAWIATPSSTRSAFERGRSQWRRETSSPPESIIFIRPRRFSVSTTRRARGSRSACSGRCLVRGCSRDASACTRSWSIPSGAIRRWKTPSMGTSFVGHAPYAHRSTL